MIFKYKYLVNYFLIKSRNVMQHTYLATLRENLSAKFVCSVYEDKSYWLNNIREQAT